MDATDFKERDMSADQVIVQPTDSDVEYVLATPNAGASASRNGATVQIFTGGVGNLVFVNGQRIGNLLKVELPVKPNEVSPQVVLTLWAKDVHHTRVTAEEWKRLKDADQLTGTGFAQIQSGEAVIPGYDPGIGGGSSD